MIICPTCFNEELEGALFCIACGTQLTHQTKSPTETVVYTNPNQPADSAAETRISKAAAPGTTQVAFKIVSSGQIIPLEGGEEFTIGRVSGTQPILPDIDLTPYQAYEGGVSRLHATLHIAPESVTISDLGSANGTQINGVKVPAHSPQALNNGDVLTLGKFRVEIIIHP